MNFCNSIFNDSRAPISAYAILEAVAKLEPALVYIGQISGRVSKKSGTVIGIGSSDILISLFLQALSYGRIISPDSELGVIASCTQPDCRLELT